MTVYNRLKAADEVIIHLTIDGELIETTPEHPFYTADGKWVEAEDLQPGDQIYALDGTYGTVESVVVVENADQRMYNLTVDTAHTFFVGDGDWLVHNCPEQLEFPGMPEKQYPPGVHSDRLHSVLYETNLRHGADYPHAIRIKKQANEIRNQHNKYANEQLLAEVQWMKRYNPNSYNRFKALFPEVDSHLNAGNLYEAPDGWTWHHVTNRVGVMQLVPTAQHTYQPMSRRLHPNNLGGFARWVNKLSGRYLGEDVDLLDM